MAETNSQRLNRQSIERLEQRQAAAGSPPAEVTTVHPIRFLVSCLPLDHEEAHIWSIVVEYRRDGRWRVGQGDHRSLDADGVWSWGYDGPGSDKEPVTDEERKAYREGHEVWVDAHRFDLDTALQIAREAAPKLTCNGWTLADVRARDAAREREKA